MKDHPALLTGFGLLLLGLQLIFVIVILFGCNKNIQKTPMPDNLISEEKMVDVIYEMTLITVSKGVNRRILENSGVIPEKYIFEKYNF